MALIAKLQFGNNDIGMYNKEYLISDVKMHYCREYSHVSPTSVPRCESVEITVVETDNKDITLYEWYIGGEPRSGRLVLDNNSIHTMADVDDNRYVLFNDAICFALSENYDVERPRRREVKLEFEADEIILDSIIFKHL